MKPEDKFLPLRECVHQTYLGRGIHTLGLIRWILEQTGAADVVVTTFSTSVEFLTGFWNLKKKGLISSATMVADIKASKKTARLNTLIDSCFDTVCLAENHSKVVLVKNDRFKITVISSQNNTYGGRIECTYVTSDATIHDTLHADVMKMVEKSLKLKNDGNNTRLMHKD